MGLPDKGKNESDDLNQLIKLIESFQQLGIGALVGLGLTGILRIIIPILYPDIVPLLDSVPNWFFSLVGVSLGVAVEKSLRVLISKNKQDEQYAVDQALAKGILTQEEYIERSKFLLDKSIGFNSKQLALQKIDNSDKLSPPN